MNLPHLTDKIMKTSSKKLPETPWATGSADATALAPRHGPGRVKPRSAQVRASKALLCGRRPFTWTPPPPGGNRRPGCHEKRGILLIPLKLEQICSKKSTSAARFTRRKRTQFACWSFMDGLNAQAGSEMPLVKRPLGTKAWVSARPSGRGRADGPAASRGSFSEVGIVRHAGGRVGDGYQRSRQAQTTRQQIYLFCA